MMKTNNKHKDHLMLVKNTHEMKSQIMNDILDKCRTIAKSRKTVFIVGEYGSGKGWIAKMIHELSDRKDQLFSRINCYSMYAEEIKRKLFGYLSFTGNSVKLNRGILEECDGGTIFFEGFEVLPIDLQQQILESIQQKTISHLGSTLRIHTDVRLITSMYHHSYRGNRNNLRRDNAIHEANPYIIFQPPLRNRREDIAPLINNFLDEEFLENYNSEIPEITPGALYLCIQYDWPGNIRQLKNTVKLGLLLSNNQTLEPQHLSPSIWNGQPSGDKLLELQKSRSYQTAEKNLIQELFQKSVSHDEIAASLGIKLKSLEKKIESYQLKDVKAEN